MESKATTTSLARMGEAAQVEARRSLSLKSRIRRGSASRRDPDRSSRGSAKEDSFESAINDRIWRVSSLFMRSGMAVRYSSLPNRPRSRSMLSRTMVRSDWGKMSNDSSSAAMHSSRIHATSVASSWGRRCGSRNRRSISIRSTTWKSMIRTNSAKAGGSPCPGGTGPAAMNAYRVFARPGVRSATGGRRAANPVRALRTRA